MKQRVTQKHQENERDNSTLTRNKNEQKAEKEAKEEPRKPWKEEEREHHTEQEPNRNEREEKFECWLRKEKGLPVGISIHCHASRTNTPTLCKWIRSPGCGKPHFPLVP